MSVEMNYHLHPKKVEKLRLFMRNNETKSRNDLPELEFTLMRWNDMF